jgi:hypothetical protein
MYLMAFSTYWLEEEAVWGLPALVSRIKAAINRYRYPTMAASSCGCSPREE